METEEETNTKDNVDSNSVGFDYSSKGKRIRLISTKDPYTKLKKGDTGTIQFRFVNSDRIAIVTKWDSGSNLSVIEGVDEYEIFEDEFTI